VRRSLVGAALAGAAVLAAGPWLAAPYARLVAPFHAALAEFAAGPAGGWRVERAGLRPALRGPGEVLAVTATLWSPAPAARPIAVVESTLGVDAALLAPATFAALLAGWPARGRRERLLRLGAGLALWPLLEGLTNGCQLLAPLYEAHGLVAAAPHAAPLWLAWSEVLEAGGRLAVAGALALLVLAAGRRRTVTVDR